jgi:arabinan endo-1,5-alpha-L-arabinosidase
MGAPVASARESEAADIIAHAGYYYLFVNHGSCCKGKLSEYNIRVGRSRKPDGPYVDKHGVPLEKGGGSLFIAAHDHRIGPGHFGRLLDYDVSPTGDEGGPERFSIHYEADLTRNGRSVLDVRPLLWAVNDWPVAGDNLAEGTYEIISRQSEYTFEEHLPVPPKPADMGKAVTGESAESATAVASAPPSPTAPAPVGVLHLVRYIAIDNEKWKIAPVRGGFYSLANAGTGDAIGAAVSGVELAPYAGKDSQMWRLEQFPDGGYRIVNKATGKCLTAEGATGVTSGDFVRDDGHLWTITTP